MNTISGYVVDGNGVGVLGMFIYLYQKGKLVTTGVGGAAITNPAKTAADGSYAFSNVSDGRYRVTPFKLFVPPVSNTNPPTLPDLPNLDYFVEPAQEIIKVKDNNDEANVDFVATKLVVASTEHTPVVDASYTRAVLQSCLDRLDSWIAATDVPTAITDVIEEVHDRLPLTTPAAPHIAFNFAALSSLPPDEQKRRIYELAEQYHALIDQTVKERLVLLETLTADDVIQLSCTTCQNRYYTPGTQYYMNYSLYLTCVDTPCS